MNFTTSQIAKQLRAVYFGVNWTWSNFKDNLNDVTWEQATTKIDSFNTIAQLVFHTNYYIEAVLKVINGGSLDAHDKFSFSCPPIEKQEDWEQLLEKSYNEAEELANKIEAFDTEKLEEIFIAEKYGTYYRNFHGIIEHCHYHLGQIVILKKIIQAKS